MEKLQEQKYSNGSTLLLAMVIVSTILLIGMSISLILSRQTREGVVMRGEAIGFYVADSVIEKIALNPSEFGDPAAKHDFDIKGSNIEYKVKHETDKRYLITVKVGNNYYDFIREIKEVEELDGDDLLGIYLQKPTGWSSATVSFRLQDEDGVWFNEEVLASNSDYDDWFKVELDTEGISQGRLWYCKGEFTAQPSCRTDTGYTDRIGPVPASYLWQFPSGFVGNVCVLDDGYYFQCKFPGNFFVYIKKPTGWSSATVSFRLQDEDGVWFNEEVLASNSDYDDWFKVELDTEGISQGRLWYCKGEFTAQPSCRTDTGYTDRIGPVPASYLWQFSRFGTVCVEEGVYVKCFSPLF